MIECNISNGTLSGVRAAGACGSSWRTERGHGDTVTGGQMNNRWAAAELMWLGADGSCPVVGADDGFQLIILV